MPQQSLKTNEAQGQMRFCGKLTKGFGNRVNPDKVEEANNQISKRRHDAGSISGPDSRSVLLKGDVSDIVQPVLNAPVIAIQSKNSCRVGLSGVKGSDAVGDFFGGLVLFEMGNLAADSEDLLDVGELDVAIKICAGPDLASFYPTVSFLDTLVLRGENCSDRAIRYLIGGLVDCL